MIRKICVSVALLVTLMPVLYAVDAPAPVATQKPVPVIAEYVIDTEHSGSQANWVTGQLEAVGIAYSVQRGEAGMIQARMAAVTIMTREARMAFAAMPVDGDATLDTAGQTPELQALAEATLTSLTIIDENWDNRKGIYTIVGVLPLYGLSGATNLGAKLVSPVINLPQPETLALSNATPRGFTTFFDPKKNFTGVIIDGDDVLLTPCLFPRVFRFDAIELLGPQQWNTNNIATGPVRYAANLREAKAAHMGGERPLILKAQGTLKRAYPVLNLDDSWLLYREWTKTELSKTGPIIITLGKR